jgi:hypothetical protein
MVNGTDALVAPLTVNRWPLTVNRLPFYPFIKKMVKFAA